MRSIFLWVLLALVAFSQVIVWKEGSDLSASGPRVLHWGTPVHQTKVEQANLFVKWMAAKGETNIRVMIEPESQGSQKFVLQGVSGVAVDVIEFGGGTTRLFQGVGLLRPLDDFYQKATSMGYKIDTATREEITIDGKIYAFPAGIWTRVIVYNTEVLARYGLKPPTGTPTFEQFEELGRQFNQAANKSPGNRKNYFFAQIGPYPVETFRRGLGLGRYNETMTAPMHRDLRCRESLDRLQRWIYREKIAIGPSEAASMHMDQGIGGPNVQLFCKGQLAALLMPLWPLMQIRQISNVPMAASLLPHGGYPNSDFSVRSIGVYVGSARSGLSTSFASFFASKEYNRYLIGIGDSAPPDPKLMDSPEFRHPADHGNEWALRDFLVGAHQQHAISGEYSPFILPGVAEKTEEKTLQSFLSGLMSSGDAANQIADSIEKQMKEYLERHPERQPQWQRSLAKQKELDRLKADLGIPPYGTPGQLRAIASKITKKLPLSMIDNPFYRKYYLDMGIAE